MHICGLIDGVVHYLVDIDGVGGGVGSQALWVILVEGRMQAIAKNDADETGGCWNSDVPSSAVARRFPRTHMQLGVVLLSYVTCDGDDVLV